MSLFNFPSRMLGVSGYTHPAAKGITRRRFAFGKQVSGNSKWHRRVLAAGLKGKC